MLIEIEGIIKDIELMSDKNYRSLLLYAEEVKRTINCSTFRNSPAADKNDIALVAMYLSGIRTAIQRR